LIAGYNKMKKDELKELLVNSIKNKYVIKGIYHQDGIVVFPIDDMFSVTCVYYGDDKRILYIGLLYEPDIKKMRRELSYIGVVEPITVLEDKDDNDVAAFLMEPDTINIIYNMMGCAVINVLSKISLMCYKQGLEHYQSALIEDAKKRAKNMWELEIFSIPPNQEKISQSTQEIVA